MARELIVSLVGDASKFTKSLGEADAKASSWSSGVGKLAATAGGLLAGAKIIDFGRDAVAAFNESEQAQAKLTQALQASPATVGVTADAFSKLNKELAKHTLADDDIIAAGEGVLSTFNLTKAQIEATIPGVVDLAAKLGTDVPGAAETVGKALLGNTKALKSLGVDGFKATGDHAADLTNLMGLLDAKTKGAAQSQLDAAGPGATFNKSMDELKETVGSFLVPALSKVVEWGVKVTDFLAQHPIVTKFALAGGALAAAIWGVNAATEAWAAAQAALNVVMEANPIVLVALAVAAIGVAVYEAYQHFGPFHDAVDALWQILQTGFGWVKDNWPLLLGILTGPIGLAVVGITTHWETIKSGFTAVKTWIGDRIGDVVGFFTGLPGRIAAVTVGMWDGIKDAFRGAINWIIDGWNKLHFGIPAIDTHIPGIGKIGGFDVGVPSIPRLAAGGITNGPTLALIGDNPGGRERITPLPLGGDAGGGTTTIQLVVDGKVLTEIVHDGLLGKQRRSGNLGFEAA